MRPILIATMALLLAALAGVETPRAASCSECDGVPGIGEDRVIITPASKCSTCDGCPCGSVVKSWTYQDCKCGAAGWRDCIPCQGNYCKRDYIVFSSSCKERGCVKDEPLIMVNQQLEPRHHIILPCEEKDKEKEEE